MPEDIYVPILGSNAEIHRGDTIPLIFHLIDFQGLISEAESLRALIGPVSGVTLYLDRAHNGEKS
jgi:hypothetical protein